MDELFSWIVELYANPNLSWPAYLGALLAATLRRGQRWLFFGGVVVSILGAALAWGASDDPGNNVIGITPKFVLTVLTVWWTVTWLPGVAVGWAIRRARPSSRPWFRLSSLPPAPRATPADDAELARPLERDLRAALAPYGVGIEVKRTGEKPR